MRLLLRRRTTEHVSEQPNWKSWIPLLTVAALAWVLEILDGATAVVMMQNQGTELNPVIRGVFHGLGPLAVVLLKFGLATVVLASFLYLARARRRVLARNCLLLTVVLAAIGVASNIA
jgi:hypothetical protein